jgi:hypothetical protein
LTWLTGNIFLLFLALAIEIGRAQAACVATDHEFVGLKRVDPAWLRDYLGLDVGQWISEDQREALRLKLLTTDIFSDVQVQFKESTGGRCVLTVEVKEKWTRIPVVRGAYGGGTPLLILGGYETNAFGQMIAVGAELRRYGNLAPGAFFFLKSPRAWRGRGLWGGELWLDRRRRAFYDEKSVNYGFVDSESWTLKAQWLYPLGESSDSHWQGGFQTQAMYEEAPLFRKVAGYDGEREDIPHDVTLGQKSGYGGLFAPMLAFDNMRVEGLSSHGLKLRLSGGLSKSMGRSGGFSEVEAFGFYAFTSNVNFASHIYGASTSQNSVGSLYYLGGFDSVRGLPDGIKYGNRIFFGNFEARMVAARFHYAHIQPVVFYDSGAAWMNDHDPQQGRETSVGGGFRIAVPQIYRFVVRVDYGKSIGRSSSQGFSIGLNQFFQPYKMVF